jgi:hypothetical protein
MKGTQKKFTCPKCGKVFTAWRPDELPGAPVKCYFCGNQFGDEAAKRPPLAPPASEAAPPASEAAPPVTAAPPAAATAAPSAAAESAEPKAN